MTKDELREEAESRGLSVPSDALKADLVAALEDDDASDEQADDSEPQAQADEEQSPPEPSGDPGVSSDNITNTATTPSNIQAGSLSDVGEGATVGPQDPALTDPTAGAIERSEGRTSDAANREAGVLQGDVPPDLNEGAKPSDAGPEAYPFPPGGDVEIATIPEGDSQGEFMAPLEAEDWVILDGSHEMVPDRLDGHYAVVIDAPRIMCNCDWAPRTHEHMHPTAAILVRTRDEANATFAVPFEAFKQVLRGGLRTSSTPVGV